MKYFLITGISLLFISCSKNNSSNSSSTQPPKDSTCQIVSVKWVLGTDSLITNLSYNSNGQLAKTDEGQGNINTFTYSGSQIFMTSNDYSNYRDTTTLNKFGYVTQLVVNSNPLILYSSYFYTSDTVLNYVVTTSPLIKAPDTARYVFTDGDLTSLTVGGNTTNYTYYPDKPEQPADLSIYNQIVASGAPSFKNKHLTKSISGNSSSQDYTYTFDAAGKISTMTVQFVNSQTSGTIIYYYTYACHL